MIVLLRDGGEEEAERAWMGRVDKWLAFVDPDCLLGNLPLVALVPIQAKRPSHARELPSAMLTVKSRKGNVRKSILLFMIIFDVLLLRIWRRKSALNTHWIASSLCVPSTPVQTECETAELIVIPAS